MVDFEEEGEPTLVPSNGPAEVEDPSFVNKMLSQRLELVLLSISKGTKPLSGRAPSL